MPVTLTRRGWGFVAGAAALGLGWVLVDLRDLWYLVVFALAVPVLGLLTVLGLRLWVQVEAQVVVADPTPTAGEAVVLAATIRHRAPFAIDGAVTWALGRELHESDVSVPARGTARITREWIAPRRGPVTVGVTWFTITDPLGVASVTVPLNAATASADLLVLPRLLTAGEAGEPPHSADEPAVTAQRPQGADPELGAPGSAVREYRPGDSRRSIHWKQSARQGELLVRLREPADTHSRHVELVTNARAYGPNAAPKFEHAVSQAATIASDWARRGYAVHLVFDGGAPIACVSEGDILRRLAIVELTRGGL